MGVLNLLNLILLTESLTGFYQLYLPWIARLLGRSSSI